jgi:hypothetical protein
LTTKRGALSSPPVTDCRRDRPHLPSAGRLRHPNITTIMGAGLLLPVCFCPASTPAHLTHTRARLFHDLPIPSRTGLDRLNPTTAHPPILVVMIWILIGVAPESRECCFDSFQSPHSSRTVFYSSPDHPLPFLSILSLSTLAICSASHPEISYPLNYLLSLSPVIRRGSEMLVMELMASPLTVQV